jgi:hypothetical protein
MPSPDPLPNPTELYYIDSVRYPLKLKFGREQKEDVLFLLSKDDDSRFRTFLDGLEKRPLDTPCVELRPSPLGGLGLFTTKDCLPGDLLLSERPMVSTITFCIIVQHEKLEF